MLPLLALVAVPMAWEGFASGVDLGLSVYDASCRRRQYCLCCVKGR